MLKKVIDALQKIYVKCGDMEVFVDVEELNFIMPVQGVYVCKFRKGEDVCLFRISQRDEVLEDKKITSS